MTTTIDQENKAENNQQTENNTQLTENKKSTETLDLGNLGTAPYVTDKHIIDTLNKLIGTLFRVDNCLFKVCYTDAGKGRFTAEIINKRPT